MDYKKKAKFGRGCRKEKHWLAKKLVKYVGKSEPVLILEIKLDQIDSL